MGGEVGGGRVRQATVNVLDSMPFGAQESHGNKFRMREEGFCLLFVFFCFLLKFNPDCFVRISSGSTQTSRGAVTS